jgi:hypothetical protein
MINKELNISLRFVDKKELSRQNTLISTFETHNNSNKISINYQYLDEPNNGRIQLRLSGNVNEKNIIDDYGLNQNIELPYQYPRNFELFQVNRNVVAIPHNKGIYLLDLNSKNKQLIRYQTRTFKTSFFLDNLFVLVEEKGCKIVNLDNFKESCILFNNNDRIFIDAVKVQDNQIYIILRDVEINKMKLLVFERRNFSLDRYLKFNLADIIEGKNLKSQLKYETRSKLSHVPKYRYKSLVDSWRFVSSRKWNQLVGRVEHWYEPKKENEYFIRRVRYDYIELKIELSDNKK